MNDHVLKAAIAAASSAAESATEYKSETYGAVLLFELMRRAAGTVHSEELATVPPAGNRSEKDLTPAEFFAKKLWSTEIDKVVIAGYFLEHFGGSRGYTLDELKSCLIAAKIALPKNISLAILQAIQKGLLMEIPSQGSPRRICVLTQVGESYVQQMAQKQ
jgi:hypothetical protein